MSNLLSNMALPHPELNISLDGRYQIVEILAARLWGRTYLAQDLRRPSQPECIIHHFKTIPDIPDYSTAVRCLFVREATILEEFGNHAQVPQLLACFEDEDGFYIVQEFIGGHPLTAELQSGVPWTAEEVKRLLLEVLEPLAVVHHYGSVHGNLKPGNVLRRMSDRRPVLIDFGSLPQIQLSLMTAYGQEVAPPDATQQSYQPLEQLQGFPRPASDVYAVGIIAIQALTGTHPTQLHIKPETGEVLWEPHRQPVASALAVELIKILDRMVQCDLKKRFASAGEVLEAVNAIASLASAPMEPDLPTAATVEKQPAIAVSLGADLPETQGIRATPPAIAPKAVSPVREDLNSLPLPIPPLPPSPLAHSPFPIALSPLSQFSRLVFKFCSMPSVQLSAGGLLLTFVCAAAGWNLLSSTDWARKGNDLWQNAQKKRQAKRQVAQVSSGSTSLSARVMMGHLQQEWSTATDLFQQAEQAAAQGKLAEARQLAQAMPKIPYWQDRSAALVQQAVVKAQTQIAQQLDTAYDHARSRQFTEALLTLQQIPPGTSVDTIVQQKIQEYREKQQIRAQADLQHAYDRAIIRDFANAIPYLRQIPQGTPTYAIAQQKIAEYTQKQRIRAHTLLLSAAEQATHQDWQAALTVLTQIPSGTPIDAEVAAKMADYTNQLNQQAQEWLQQANRKARTGDLAGAIADWQKVPIGTPAYTEARHKMVLFNPASSTPQPLMQDLRVSLTAQDLNPGAHLREIIPAKKRVFRSSSS